MQLYFPNLLSQEIDDEEIKIEDNLHLLIVNEDLITKKCNYCKRKGVKEKTKYMCSKCKIHIHKKCFEIKHSEPLSKKITSFFK